jgi:hypothetical protein
MRFHDQWVGQLHSSATGTERARVLLTPVGIVIFGAFTTVFILAAMLVGRGRLMHALIDCRVSTQQQNKNLSLPAQRKECARFCKAHGWTVNRVFIEKGESAKSADRTHPIGVTRAPDPRMVPPWRTT